MKKYIIILFFFINYLCAFTQTGSKPNVSVINFSNNNFFELLPYSFTVNLGDTINDFIVEGDENSQIILDSNHTYKVVFHGRLRRSTINIYKVVNGVKNCVFSKKISFKPLPVTPLIFLTTFSSYLHYFFVPGDTIDKEKLKHAFIGAGIINYDVEKFYDVTSYSILLYEGDKIIEHKVIGAKIDGKLYKCIKNLKSGQPIIFDKIIIRGYEQYKIPTYPLVIYIK